MQVITKYVGYYRVSTNHQADNHSLPNQKERVRNFAGENLIAEFVDIDSGRKVKRKGLQAAIQFIENYQRANRDVRVVLIANELDRLTRSFAINTLLKERKINFTAIDSLNDNDFMINIKTTINTEYCEKLSFKVKQGLERAKAVGKVLGKPENLTNEAREKAYEVNRQKAAQNYNNLVAKELIQLYAEKGLTPAEILAKLQSKGVKTSRGKEFAQIVQVQRLMKK
jgi:DNA invertase Pin-like site-specific DNA recombinase